MDLDGAAEALVGMTAVMCDGIDGAWSRLRDGAGTMFSGCPVASLNVVFAARKGAVAAVAELLDELAETGLPHALEVRDGDGEVEAYARSRGFVADGSMPLMLLADAPPEPAGVPVRVLGPADMDVHLDLMARGFGAPPEVFDPLRGSTLFGEPGIGAYAAERDGEPVATAMGVRVGGWVGVFNVATPPEHRGRGYGAALTARAVRDGFAAGATGALLQSSAMGLRVYERLGFRTAETWTLWTAGSAG